MNIISNICQRNETSCKVLYTRTTRAPADVSMTAVHPMTATGTMPAMENKRQQSFEPASQALKIQQDSSRS